MRTADAADIRVLRVEDLPQALALSTSAGWNQRLEDWHRLQDLSGGASFAAISAGRVVGTAIAIDYGRFAWIAMMLVEPAYRGRGLGARLLEAAMSAVPSNRLIRLDATPVGRRLYLRYGFEDESRLTRVVAPAARPAISVGPGTIAVRALTSADLPSVAAHDLETFGGDRSTVLNWALQQAPQYARIADGNGGRPQYTFGRPGRLFDQIGPVVATDDAAATTLVGAAMASAVGRAVVVDAFDARSGLVAWLRDCGFAGERPLFRMGRRPALDSATAVGVKAPSPGPSEFAILGPDFA
jgi:ribosomal protein S18 acetylase RimI-like enzyme